MASEEIVTPSCIAEMKRGGSAVIRSTARARRLPSCSSSMIRVRREVTRPYSAATKNAFRKQQAQRGPASRAAKVTAPLSGACVLGGSSSSTRISRAEYSGRSGDTNICSISRRCGSSTARSRARSALNRVKGMPFDWSLNPYMGCVHRCTFCYVRAFELRADRPVRRSLRHVDPGQDERRRGAAPASSRGQLGAASRSRSAPPPTRTSRPRAATG